MSRFVCNLCNKEFTTKYGLQKHNTKKIPCNVDKKTKYQCDKCDAYLSSKRNLDNHIFNHRLDSIKIKHENAEVQNNNENLEDNLIDDNLIDNNLIDDNLEVNNIISKNSIEITIEEYYYYKSLKNELIKVNNELIKANDEIKKLKNENKKLTSTTINNIDNSTTNNIDNSNNIQITNNIQINIIPFRDNPIDFIDVVESLKDPNSALNDFSKIFNYNHLNQPKQQSGLNFSQMCKQEKVNKIISNNRKRDIPLASRGFIDILYRHFSKPENKNIKRITRNMYKLYTGNNTWVLITLDDTKKELQKKVVKSMIDNHVPNSVPLQADNAINFIKQDYHKNHQEYAHYHNNEFITMLKNIHTN